MGRSPCRDVNGLKKGPWTSEEDEKLVNYINKHGHSSWRALPKLAGLNRCGKSCRLRWTNYLRPDIKRGKFTAEDEEMIINLHAVLGNKWSAIATNLPGRTDNEIKNFWNTHLRKKLFRMGIDPITHRPRIDQLYLLENLPQLLASFTNPRSQWDNVMSNGQMHNVTQIAKFQLLQNILQVFSCSPPSTMLALDLLGAFPIIDHQNQQICEHNFRNIMDYPQLEGLGSSSINLRHDSQTTLILSNLNSDRTATDLNVQLMSNSNLVLNSSQINDSYNQFITNLSVPWLVSPSPSPTSSAVNQIENKNYPKGDELSNPSSTTSTALEANWGELMGDEADDYYWKEIIGQATSSSWHCS